MDILRFNEGVCVQLMQRHKLHHEKFQRLAAKLLTHDPPCMSEAIDWESSNAWMDHLAPPPKPETLSSSLPDAPGEQNVPQVTIWCT